MEGRARESETREGDPSETDSQARPSKSRNSGPTTWQTKLKSLRGRRPFVDRAISAWQSQRSSFFLPRWIFLRLLGLIYLIAFVSLWTQIDGLVGSTGISPAADFLQAAEAHFEGRSFANVPTLCWLNSSDGFLHFLCGAGVVISLLLIAGILPIIDLILLWILYLSLCSVCGVFLGFQWDVLLLETGFLTIFLAPAQILPRFSKEKPPSRIALFLFHWLLFRLMFMSGAVKLLATSNLAWQDLSALAVHYETQPLPTWIGWHAHQAPLGFHKFCVLVTFGIELILPAFIFGFRRSRMVAFFPFVGLMAIIALTGNYTFFNLLTAALCLLLLDDRFLRRFFPRRWFKMPSGAIGGTDAETENGQNKDPSDETQVQLPRWRTGLQRTQTIAMAAVAFVIVSMSGAQEALRLRDSFLVPYFIEGPITRYHGALRGKLGPFRSVNSYGLFASMTTTRPEIVGEGSDDGREWKAYEFTWKPGALDHKPGFVQPHQPRLDWQMWFAALGDYRQNPWLINFQVRLLEGEPAVLALIEENPFPDRPPRYIRSVLYQYNFTDGAARESTGQWWRRERLGLYSPPFSLEQLQRR